MIPIARPWIEEAEADAAPDHHDVPGRGQHVDGGRPVDPGGGAQRIGQGSQAGAQAIVVLPFGDQATE